ncbi:response regulator [Nonomuraea basaltis]|uniref:response regulator n=1 Tax=Nonomuraea basaltis TaxID=2495887 RepID=UPI00110C4A1F|nr:response regulator transcription factor [Nonomuraea basaltis]TMR95068.1 response regulator transcription factor [Nonomuraea basaltis]
MIRVVLADDQDLVRGAFAQLVNSAADMEVVGEAATGAEVVDVASASHPDVIVMDIRMPDRDGIEATRLICADAVLAATRVLMLTTFETEENIVRALRAGASGFLAKSARPAQLLDAIRTVASGEALLSPGATRSLIARVVNMPDSSLVVTGRVAELTAREREVLVLIAAGLSNDELAGHLVLSPLTIKSHIGRILAKLGARDRAQLVMAAYESGLTRPGDRR